MEYKLDELFEELKGVLKRNADAAKGFEKASENADSAALANYFMNKSRQRENFNKELRTALRAEYADDEVDGSIKAEFHRAWMDIKDFFSQNSDEAMLEESIRGDKDALDVYDELLEEEKLPVGVRNLIMTQRAHIQKDIAVNERLEDIEEKE